MQINKIWRVELKKWAEGNSYVVLLPQDVREYIPFGKSETIYIGLDGEKLVIGKKPFTEGFVDRRTIEIGNSIYVVLPKNIVDMKGWKEGQQFELDGDIGKQLIFLKPLSTSNVDKMEVVEDGRGNE